MIRNESEKISTIEILKFGDYVSSFYDQDKGIYPVPGANKGMINVAISKYLRDLDHNPYWEWGGGDSIDRERTRDILEYIIDKYSDIEKKEPKIKKII